MVFIRADLLVERICLVVSGLLLKSVEVGPVVIRLLSISIERFWFTTEKPRQESRLKAGLALMMAVWDGSA